MAIPEYNYIPEYTRLGVNNKPKDVITASYWNGLFNALSHQGDHTAEELGNVLNHFTAAINDVEGIAGSKYVKPTNGIPKTDLAATVQTSLDKADTALQTHQSLAAYRTAEAQDLIDNTKQDKLIAGKNINIAADGKTISAINCSDKILSVTITGDTDAEIVADKTYAEIKAAIDSGYPIHTITKNGDTFVPRVNFESAVERITLAWTERLDSNTWVEVVYEVNTQDSWGVTLREYVTPNEIGNLIALKTQAKDNLVVAINEVKRTTDAKQDKLIAGENITIAADGKTISAAGGGGGGSTVELDTTLSEAGKAADAKAVGDALAGKVDKVTGKGLSSNDYTDAAKAKVDALAPVATSGSYNDLTNKPTIPAPVTEQTVSGWGFTKNTGTYSKPTGGIPKADLTNDVQASLGKADTALQEHQSLAAYRTAAEQNIIDNGKQDKITSTNKLAYSLISGTPTIPTVPTNVSAFTNDAGYLTLAALPKYEGVVE